MKFKLTVCLTDFILSYEDKVLALLTIPTVLGESEPQDLGNRYEHQVTTVDSRIQQGRSGMASREAWRSSVRKGYSFGAHSTQALLNTYFST